MRRLLALALIALLAACGQQTPDAPGAAPAAAAPSDHSWLWGVGGYLLGRMSAPSTPAVTPSYPTHTRTIIREVQKPAPAPAVVKPPVVTTTPKVTPAPAPVAKPSYSSPSFSSGYKPSPAPRVSYGGGFRR